MLTEEYQDLPRRTKARLLFGKFLVAMGYKIWPEEFFESIQREELVQMADRIDGVECSLHADTDRSGGTEEVRDDD
ncbi:hypothetical protein [Natrarchaeobaculum sulfurireducens]|nr:hypothetical protein [Natrarchaeobaculum sulfurireducens]